MKPFIIGFHGPIGSGKDTLTRMLLQRIPEGSGHLARFAEPLYAMATAFDPAFDPQMPHEAKDEFVLGLPELGTRRNFLEKLGTDWGRNLIHEDIWLKRVAHKVACLEGATPIVVIPDVRRDNEAAYVRARGVLVHLYPNWECRTTEHVSGGKLPRLPGDMRLALSEGQQAKGFQELLSMLNPHLPLEIR